MIAAPQMRLSANFHEPKILFGVIISLECLTVNVFNKLLIGSVPGFLEVLTYQACGLVGRWAGGGNMRRENLLSNSTQSALIAWYLCLHLKKREYIPIINSA